ncbi:MAG: histidine phosphatase family protein [Acidobacteriota bacterium]
MSREIGLLRHGKSDWAAGSETDHERPLTDRGVEGARLMGRFLREIGRAPDQVFTSSAVRARTTAELAVAAGQWDCPIEVTRVLYVTEPEQVFELLRGLDQDLHRVLLVGHNPAWEDMLAALVGGGRFKMPTASLAWIDLSSDGWPKCGPGAGILRWLVTPKVLKNLS